MEPNKEALRGWTKLLRSGDFQQAQNMLRDPATDGRCCLGVACDYYAHLFKDSGWARESVDNRLEFIAMDERSIVETESGTLPFVVAEFFETGEDLVFWIPATRNDEDYGYSETGIAATKLNDEWEFTFEPIADLVDWYYDL